jgi:hypothetical protein
LISLISLVLKGGLSVNEKESIEKLKAGVNDKITLNTVGPRLKVMKPFYHGLISLPEEIKENTAAYVVFYNLQQCYEQSGNVSEGIVEDVIWGFRQAGIPANTTWKGINDLKKLGFMYFHDGTGRVVLGDATEKVWYKWTLKFLDLLAGLQGPAIKLTKDERIAGKDVNWESL